MRPTATNRADYFLHEGNRSTIVKIILNKHREYGYYIYFSIMEALTISENHYYDISDDDRKQAFYIDLNTTQDRILPVLQSMIQLEVLDPECYADGILWCQELVDNLRPLYVNRRKPPPLKPYTKPTVPIQESYGYPISIFQHTPPTPAGTCNTTDLLTHLLDTVSLDISNDNNSTVVIQEQYDNLTCISIAELSEGKDIKDKEKQKTESETQEAYPGITLTDTGEYTYDEEFMQSYRDKREKMKKVAIIVEGTAYRVVDNPFSDVKSELEELRRKQNEERNDAT